MAYVNTSHIMEGETETSNYTSLTQPDVGDVPYSTISTEMVEIASANLEPSNRVQRQHTNIHTRVRGHGEIEKNNDQQFVICTCQKAKLKLIMVVFGMVVIAAASSTITAFLLKQNFDNLLTDIREEVDSIKQDIDHETTWSEWSHWGKCSATCNGGIQSRVRTCDESDKGLPYCFGTNVDIDACNNDICVSTCNTNSNTCVENTLSEWSEWSDWGACSATCNGGIQSRVRTCNESDNGQHVCVGNDVDIDVCYSNICVSTCNTTNNTCEVPMVYFTMRQANSDLVSGKVTFSTTVANVGNGYNNQTGEFVCPVSGLYHFYYSLLQKSTSHAFCYIKHNDKSLTQAYTYSDGTYDAASTSVYIQLAVGDVVTVGDCGNWQYVSHGGHSGVFTGSLIHL